MGGLYSTYGRQERSIAAFRSGDLREIHHLEDLDLDERVILQWIFKKRGEEAWTRLLWLE
jgi:hypothetical protein